MMGQLAGPVRIAAVLGFQLCLGVTAIRSYQHMRAAHARSQSTAESLRAAQNWEPADVETLLALAKISMEEGRLEDAASMLMEARRRSPADARVLIESGLLQEQLNDLENAERDLVASTRAAATFEPQWTLANFYFRHGPPSAFNRAITKAQLLTTDRLPATFKLCTVRSERDGLPECVAPDVRVVAAYVEFLLATSSVQKAISIANQFRGLPDSVLLRLVDQAAGVQASAEILPIWQELSRRKQVPPKPNLEAIVNGTFRSRPSGIGFDWHLSSSPSLSYSFAAPAARIWLDGSESERLDLLWQVVPTRAGGKYRAQFEYRTEGIAPGSGPSWVVTDNARTFETVPLSSDSWRAGSLDFAASDSTTIALHSVRRPGFRRIEGSIEVRNIRMVEMP